MENHRFTIHGLKVYLVKVKESIKGISRTARQINTVLYLFALCLIAVVLLIWNSKTIGLPEFAVSVLVVCVPLLIIIAGILAWFKPGALLMTSEQWHDLELTRLGDSSMNREYASNELVRYVKLIKKEGRE